MILDANVRSDCAAGYGGQVGVRDRALRRVVLVAAAVMLVAAAPSPTEMPGPPCSSPVPPRPEARHASGLALPTPLPRCYGAPVYEPLNKASSDASLLAESHPHDFAHPWADHVKRELVVSVTGATGEGLARSWISSGATYTAPSVGKSTFLPQPAVAVRIRTVTRSYAQLAKLMDDIIDATRAGLPDGSAIRSIGPDAEYDRVFIEVQHLSDALATALASRFGTEAIAVRVDPAVGPFTNLSGGVDTPVDPILVGVVVAGSLLGLGLVVFVMNRRARSP